MDPDWGLAHAGFELGAAAAWTRYLVWTRPNWRQGTYYVDANAIPLLHCMATGATILQADGPTGTTLTLFPGTARATVLSSAITRRHSHAIILRNTPGIGVDAWLDGVQVASAVSNPAPASANGQVLYLHDGSLQGSAQSWFHEAANWERALTAAEISTLITCQSRWVLGPRKGVNLLVMGQSNAAWFAYAGGALAVAQGAAWYLGAASYAYNGLIAGAANAPARYAIVSGHPISNSSPPLFPPAQATARSSPILATAPIPPHGQAGLISPLSVLTSPAARHLSRPSMNRTSPFWFGPGRNRTARCPMPARIFIKPRSYDFSR